MQDDVREKLVHFLDAVARDAVRGGVSPIKLWPQVQSRIVVAARTTSTPQEWATKVLRGMRVDAPSQATCEHLHELVHAIDNAAYWLDDVEREAAFLVAEVRELKARKKEAAASKKPRRSKKQEHDAAQAAPLFAAGDTE